ncbi:MAG: hypothetical protein TE42_08400 [Candidatus Synechococcus spongiarum SP3]|uniref:Uncharacterized protein n=1 Tax=Candidatus Synechococcus spongiarum SP3 TaxID=1604020 RepID=A0A0G2HJQ9_9SYNE|nr:MAG: hypothetical protein TE42_08400 [Candidatus Synechococcus spongiarum SP3]
MDFAELLDKITVLESKSAKLQGGREASPAGIQANRASQVRAGFWVALTTAAGKKEAASRRW